MPYAVLLGTMRKKDYEKGPGYRKILKLSAFKTLFPQDYDKF
jgi:hypothetical protein